MWDTLKDNESNARAFLHMSDKLNWIYKDNDVFIDVHRHSIGTTVILGLY